MRYLNKLYFTVAVGALLCSCTVHKTLHKESEQVDSTSVIKSEASDVSRHDSSLTLEKSDGWTRETVIEYDATQVDSSAPHYREAIDALSKGGLVLSGQPRSYYDSLNLHTVYTVPYRPIAKITIRETGTSNTRQTGTYNNTDSNTAKTDAGVNVSKKKETVSSTTDVKPSIGLCVLYVVVGLVVFVGVGYLIRGFVV